MDFPEDREPLDKASAMTALLRHPIQRLMDGHPRTISELAAKARAAGAERNPCVRSGDHLRSSRDSWAPGREAERHKA